MKAAVLREINKPLEIEDIAHGDPGPREVLIRTVAAGVCHSDLHFQNGSYPYPLPAVLGHESAGTGESIRQAVYIMSINQRTQKAHSGHLWSTPNFCYFC